MIILRKSIVATFVATCVTGFTGPAFADAHGKHAHPGQEQAKDRAEQHHRRVAHEHRDGKLQEHHKRHDQANDHNEGQDRQVAHDRRDDKGQERHPRREEVNNRIDRQDRRITEDHRDGKLTGAQAQALRQQEQGVRSMERADAAQNGGHITRREQAQLNGGLNAIDREIPD